jgi:signal transduction histidine kinase
VKYSPAGSPVEFRVEQAGLEAVFTVRDRGLGIPTVDQAKLFQAFTRGSNVGDTPGTGLGLVIVQRCVTLHGGTVTLASTPGAGTTVIVRLPLFIKNESDTALIRRWTGRPSSPTP